MGDQSIDWYYVEKRNLDIETSKDIENLRTPDDWILEECKVFGSGCKMKWVCEDGGFILTEPYPHPNHYIHSVNLSGEKEDVEGINDVVRKCLEYMRSTTSCKPVEVNGSDESYITYTSSLYHKDLMERGNGKLDIDCVHCDNDSLIVTSQSTTAALDDEIEIEYELVCTVCETSMRIQETIDTI